MKEEDIVLKGILRDEIKKCLINEKKNGKMLLNFTIKRYLQERKKM